MSTEIVYLGHDNSVDLVLKADDAAFSLAAVTSMTLTVNGMTISSDNGDTDPIRWIKSGYETGEVRLFLGGQTLSIGSFKCPLVVYDAVNVEGIVWGDIILTVKAEVEGA